MQIRRRFPGKRKGKRPLPLALQPFSGNTTCVDSSHCALFQSKAFQHLDGCAWKSRSWVSLRVDDKPLNTPFPPWIINSR
jgi:hypothetical protein